MCTVFDHTRVKEGEQRRGEGKGKLLHAGICELPSLLSALAGVTSCSFSFAGGFSSLEVSSDHLFLSTFTGRQLAPAPDWDLDLSSPYLPRLSLLRSYCLLYSPFGSSNLRWFQSSFQPHMCGSQLLQVSLVYFQLYFKLLLKTKTSMLLSQLIFFNVYRCLKHHWVIVNLKLWR